MIKTERAYLHTQKTVAGLETALQDYGQRGGQNVSPRLRQATLDAMQSVIDEWRTEISEYETLRLNAPLSYNKDKNCLLPHGDT